MRFPLNFTNLFFTSSKDRKLMLSVTAIMVRMKSTKRKYVEISSLPESIQNDINSFLLKKRNPYKVQWLKVQEEIKSMKHAFQYGDPMHWSCVRFFEYSKPFFLKYHIIRHVIIQEDGGKGVLYCQEKANTWR